VGLCESLVINGVICCLLALFILLSPYIPMFFKWEKQYSGLDDEACILRLMKNNGGGNEVH
jgi:ABC-type cobalt transport system substrate-binding protein